jgi:dTDP-glucose pyrophosphorylase
VKDLEPFLVDPGTTIREAIARIDRNTRGIVLVVDDQRRLVGTVTDGDIRRKVLEGIDLERSVEDLLLRSSDSPYFSPVTISAGKGKSDALSLMRSRSIRHLPVLDDDGRVLDLLILDDLIPAEPLALRAVIMAGGEGTRLRPLTEDTPKPMLPVGDRPLLEHTIEQLKNSGIHSVNISTHYRSEKIREHFGDGRKFGVEINYISEDQPLGTAGALGVMERVAEPLLVINGDILTKVDYRAMMAFHKGQGADLTVGVRQYDLEVPFGVIESDGPLVTGITEKPVTRLFVNAGIYLLEPDVVRSVPRGQPCEMTDLMQKLIEDKGTVVNFPIVEYWLDIGRPEDYERAQRHMRDGGPKQ